MKHIETVEVPIERKMNIFTAIPIIGLLLVFTGIFFLAMTVGNTGIRAMRPFILLFVGISALLTVLAIAVNPIIKSRHLKKVCTVPLKGQFAGYDIKRYYHKSRTVNTYAPKYKIFINHRYEIRTLDRYSGKNPRYEGNADLMVNPNGFEIRRADSEIGSRKSKKIIKKELF